MLNAENTCRTELGLVLGLKSGTELGLGFNSVEFLSLNLLPVTKLFLHFKIV